MRLDIVGLLTVTTNGNKYVLTFQDNINEDQTDWDEWLPYAMNTIPHTAIGFTPFKLMYDHQATLPTALTKQPK